MFDRGRLLEASTCRDLSAEATTDQRRKNECR
jgi:hypothetical protein